MPVDESVIVDVPPVSCCDSDMVDDSINESLALLAVAVEGTTDVFIVAVIIFELLSKIAVEVLVSMLEIPSDDDNG
jgi:hypothetical protein